MIDFRMAVAWLFLCVGPLTGACADAGFGAPCEIPKPILEKACKNKDGSATDVNATDFVANCVSDPSYDCESQICVVSNGSSPFCSDTCETEGSECHSKGICQRFKFANFNKETQKYEDGFFCVKKSTVQ